MKNVLTGLFLAASCSLAGLSAAAADPLKVGISAEPYPPFTVPDASGNWTGWEVDLAKAVCAEAKLDCVITPVAWDGIIPALQSGKIDMIVSSMSVTDERKKVIDFSDPYYRTNSAVIGLKDEKIEVTPEGLAGKVIGAQVGTRHLRYAQAHFETAGATVREYQTQDEANSDLAAGRIDAVEADEVAMRAFVASDAGKDCCDFKGVVADDPDILGIGSAIGVRKTDTELRDKLSAAIHAIRDNGTYQEFSKKYFDFDIYGR
ncbi:transporter substrate-binding domain-containing protein [Paracoccus aminophilus]|uniref:Polar amino acid transport system, substrate-binding protein n=1 Tax=Paracoccus aminophilus JCM 7686 TaxID=1367847 RepID=S5Y207_PARAH|nr:transporter substrate-binding domain-containing protein [Paracoccus aminophilus]AGT09770.1 polar amino acid transport system, substrate-binding protein [Paracoccus aminophilus JCM 7686]